MARTLLSRHPPHGPCLTEALRAQFGFGGEASVAGADLRDGADNFLSELGIGSEMKHAFSCAYKEDHGAMHIHQDKGKLWIRTRCCC